MWFKAVILALADVCKFIGLVILLLAGIFWLALSCVLLGIHWGEYLVGEQMSASFSNGNLPLQSSIPECMGFILANLFWFGLFTGLFIKQVQDRKKSLLSKV